MNNKMNVKDIEDKYVLPTYPRRDIVIERGEGIYLFDDKGKRYLDCFSNYGVNVLGHNNPEISKAIIKQINELSNLHTSFYNSHRALLSQRLVRISPKNIVKVYYSSSGAEAVEAAIKFAWAATGRRKIVSAKLGYHGKTIAALSATTSNPKYRKAFLPLIPGFVQVSFNDVEALKSAITKETAGVILEPIQGESGVRPASKEYLRTANDVCHDTGALLILDEIQTAFRTGSWLACEAYNLNPDIMCLAKGIASGIPMGVTLTTEEVSKKLYTGAHTCTLGGNPLACSAALATLEYIEKNKILKHVVEIGNYFINNLKKINNNIIREIRGKGLMTGVEIKKRNTLYLKALQEKGVIAAPAGATVIRFLPPLIIKKENVDFAAEKLEEVLSQKNS